MSLRRIAPIAAVIVGVLLVLLAGLYLLEPASSLPAVVPGHVGASDPEHAHHHVKHAIAAFAVALALFAYAWFNTGPAAAEAAAP